MERNNWKSIRGNGTEKKREKETEEKTEKKTEERTEERTEKKREKRKKLEKNKRYVEGASCTYAEGACLVTITGCNSQFSGSKRLKPTLIYYTSLEKLIEAFVTPHFHNDRSQGQPRTSGADKSHQVPFRPPLKSPRRQPFRVGPLQPFKQGAAIKSCEGKVVLHPHKPRMRREGKMGEERGIYIMESGQFH